jgi:hypothetical protein
MHRKYLLVVTAFAEGGTGLVLLALPSVPLALLLGVDQPSGEVAVCARIAGAALLAIGAACWAGRHDGDTPAQLGLLLGVLFYDVAAAAILAYAGLAAHLTGVALWPAVVVHAALAGWCVASFRVKPRDADPKAASRDVI